MPRKKSQKYLYHGILLLNLVVSVPVCTTLFFQKKRISRAEMRRMLLSHFPHLIPYFESLYGEAASL
eukprot:SAG11_NODE_29735_length_307_cov_6.451923_1_plen_66_part_10